VPEVEHQARVVVVKAADVVCCWAHSGSSSSGGFAPASVSMGGADPIMKPSRSVSANGPPPG
jgi:hypothetical protein